MGIAIGNPLYSTPFLWLVTGIDENIVKKLKSCNPIKLNLNQYPNNDKQNGSKNFPFYYQSFKNSPPSRIIYCHYTYSTGNRN
jgi:hypothetical protein